jgi:hypothetical protein
MKRAAPSSSIEQHAKCPKTEPQEVIVIDDIEVLEPVPSHRPFLQLVCTDCVRTIINFMDTRTWIQFSYTCRELNAFKYVKALMIHKKRSINFELGRLEVLCSLMRASGTLFNVDFQEGDGEDEGKYVDDRFFGPLTGTIHTLNMSYCNRVTDAAFVHLKGIHTLRMFSCYQKMITDAAFEHIQGIHSLNISGCNQITDAAFVHFKGIHKLYMLYCAQTTITDKAFEHLKGIHTLNMSHCTQHTITNKAFEHLKGIHTLDISGCKRVTDAAFEHLRGIHTLDMAGCRQITDRAFEHLKGIHTLSVGACTQLTDAAMAHISGVRNLAVWGCTRLTDEAFRHLAGVEVLNMNRCSDTLITPAVLGYLRGARYISAARCDQFREYDRLLRLLDTRTKMFLVPYLEDSTKNVASEITQQPPQ